MTGRNTVLAGGFAEPVFGSQSVFRQLMDGMARPGTIQTIGTDVGQPDPLGAAAGAVALTVCDHDTPVWLSAALAKSAAGEWIGFHAGAPMTREKAEARFAFVEAAAALASLGLFSPGTQEYPDRSTTLIIKVSGLAKDRRCHSQARAFWRPERFRSRACQKSFRGSGPIITRSFPAAWTPS